MKPYETRLRTYSSLIEIVDRQLFAEFPMRGRSRKQLNTIFNYLMKRKYSQIPAEIGVSIFMNGVRISEEEYKELLINN